MTYLFGASATLLAVLVLFRAWELSRDIEVASSTRDALDRAVTGAIAGVLHGAHRVYVYLRRDVVAHGLQYVSYLALRLVRRAERVLTRWVGFFQSARMGRGRTKKSRPQPREDTNETAPEAHTQSHRNQAP